MDVQNLYEHLVKKGYIGPQKARIHVNKVTRIIEGLLQVDCHSAQVLAQQLVLKSRREYWQKCLIIPSKTDNTPLSESLERVLDNHYLRQSGDIWGDIKSVIATFNSENDKNQLPADRSNIALSLNGSKSITVMQFISILVLSPEFLRHTYRESAPNLVPLWQNAFGKPIEFSGKTLSLKEHLVRAIYSGLPIDQWQKRVLSILREFFIQTRMNLGYTSWATLSRGIKGFSGDYISQEDLRRFTQSGGNEGF